MKRMTVTSITLAIIAIVIAFATSGSTIKAQNPPVSVSGQSDEGHEPSLVGVWVTHVTRRNCETGEPIGAPGNSQNTFAKGGTLLETVGPSILRSPGNGIWKHELGWHEYSFVLRFMASHPPGAYRSASDVREMKGPTAPCS